MRSNLLAVLLLLLAVTAVNAQSGRRSAATPSPTPKVANPEDPNQYSESKPRPGRVRPTERFPGIASGSTTAKTTDKTADAAQPATELGDDEVLRVQTDLVTIPVSVFDRNGLYIPGLRQQDFKIYEDGVEQNIAYFGAQDKPFTVALLLDTSLSSEYRIGEIKSAARAFVDQLRSNDAVLVIEFNGSVKVRTKVTNDRSVIYKAIDKVGFNSGTSLYNAVDEALRKQLSQIEGRKAVVLFTDGVDTTSRKNSYDSTLNYAEESDALIFPIYINTYFDVQRQMQRDIMFGRDIKGTRPEEYALGRKYLDDLAQATGGRVFRPETTPGGLERAFEGIAEELRRQYNIGYVPSNEGKPGQRKTIKVRVNRPNLVIRARDSYVVGSSQPKPASPPEQKPN